MLGVLLESRARMQRRTGGMALSVVAHVALIGMATAATVHGKTEKRGKEKVDVVFFTPPPKPAPVPVQPQTTSPVVNLSRAPSLPVIDFVAPPVVPPSLPPINSGGTPTPDDFVIVR